VSFDNGVGQAQVSQITVAPRVRCLWTGANVLLRRWQSKGTTRRSQCFLGNGIRVAGITVSESCHELRNVTKWTELNVISVALFFKKLLENCRVKREYSRATISD
jgi:hypothetical protein